MPKWYGLQGLIIIIIIIIACVPDVMTYWLDVSSALLCDCAAAGTFWWLIPVVVLEQQLPVQPML
jgi:hypothetical protein